MQDIKSKLDSLKMLKQQMKSWGKDSIRKKAGRQEETEKPQVELQVEAQPEQQSDQDSILMKLIQKLVK